MSDDGDARLQKYKRDFCKHNRCSVEEFFLAYRDFRTAVEAVTDPVQLTRWYRMFAQKWGIRVIQQKGVPYAMSLKLCVHMAAIKLFASSDAEARQTTEVFIDDTQTKH